MTKKPAPVEPCDFGVLGLPVTDDVSVIVSRYESVRKENATLENSAIERNRQRYKDIVSAGTSLKNDTKRAAAVKLHTDAFSEYVVQFCLGASKRITTENRDFLIGEGQRGLYHLSPELSRRIVDQTIAANGVVVGGHNAAPPAPPRLVEALAVDGAERHPRLRWRLPDSGCDHVTVRARADRFPANDTDGREVFSGVAQEWLDTEATPGATAYYAVFSVSGTRSSSPLATKIEHFYGVPVSAVASVGDLEQVSLTWQPPAVPHKQVVVYRWEGPGEGVTPRREGLPTPRPGTVQMFGDKTHKLLDNAATGIVAGTRYQYRVFVDYGLVNGRHECSEGRSTIATPVRRATAVTNLRVVSTEKGLLLTWNVPSELCDGITVVRSAHKYPTRSDDGDAVTLGRVSQHLDTRVDAGTTYHYTAFSLHQGHASASAFASGLYAKTATHFIAADPIKDPGHVCLSWTLPTAATGWKLFTRKGAAPELSRTTGGPEASSGEEVPLPSGRPTTFRTRAEAGTTHHYALLVLYANGEWSEPAKTSARSVRPAVAVTDLNVAVTSEGHVALQWAKPERQRPYRFHVLRRECVAAATDVRPEERLATVEQVEFVDRPTSSGAGPTPGTRYEYAIQAIADRVVATRSDWREVLVTSDVVLRSVVGTGGAVTLEWTPPANVARVEVRRHDGVVVPCNSDRAVDERVVNGTSYEYTITAVFEKSGVAWRSPGVRAAATPVPPAAPVRDLSVAYTDGAVRLTWTLPTRRPERILVSRSEGSVVLAAGTTLDLSAITVHGETSGDAVLFEDRDAPFGMTHHYAVYTVSGRTATYCGALAAPLFAPVESLRGTNGVEAIVLQWRWPTDATLVRIRRCAASTGAIETRTCTRPQYERLGDIFFDRIPERRADTYAYDIRVAPFDGVGMRDSLIGVSLAVYGGPLPPIPCKVKKRQKAFEVHCGLRGVASGFGGLVLVRNEHRDPVSSQDGLAVDRFLPTGGPLPSSITLRDEAPSRSFFYNVFLCVGGAMAMAEVISAPLAQRTLILALPLGN